MRTKLVVLLLCWAGLAFADVFKLTELTVTGETQTTGTVFVGASGDAPSNINDSSLWTLTISDSKAKSRTSVHVDSATWDSSTHTITLTFAPSALGTGQAQKLDWTATFNNILQAAASAPSGSFISAASTKDDADIYLFGSFLAAYSTKPLYTIDAKVSWLPEIKTSGYFLGLVGTLSSNSDSNPPVDRSRIDPDSITASLALRRRIRQVSFDINPLEGQFSRKYPASDLITAGTLKWVLRPIYDHGQAVVLYPFIGYELGKNLNKPSILFQQPVDFSRYDNITRLLTGAHGALLLLKKSVTADSPYRLAIQGDYTARILFSPEPFVNSGYAGTDHISLVSVRGNTRHYVEAGISYNVSDLFGIEAKYKYGSLPPLFEFLEHQVVIGITFKGKLPH